MFQNQNNEQEKSKSDTIKEEVFESSPTSATDKPLPAERIKVAPIN